MKIELDSRVKVLAWIHNPLPAIFQGQDLLDLSGQLASYPLAGCVFLGCQMGPELLSAAAKASCFIVPPRPDMPFDAFSPGLYSPVELFDALVKGGEYENCRDRKIYVSVYDKDTKIPIPVDVDVTLLRRIHDASIAEALDDILDEPTSLRTVAIMGGHDVERTKPVFAQIARMALTLTLDGYLIATGGGPGLMEAGNLGAYCAGFTDPEGKLKFVLDAIKDAPTYKDPNWLKLSFTAWQAMGRPDDPKKSRSIGIPTWFYGHEPPNVFATDIAKYFENSVREEGLLAIAAGGIIFAEGNGGTVQEIFQDANQNYYRTQFKKKSPMILFGTDYWNPLNPTLNVPTDKRKPVFPLLRKLANEKTFEDYVFISDDPEAIVKFIKEHPPAA